jgi:hypothetical protein
MAALVRAQSCQQLTQHSFAEGIPFSNHTHQSFRHIANQIGIFQSCQQSSHAYISEPVRQHIHQGRVCALRQRRAEELHHSRQILQVLAHQGNQYFLRVFLGKVV